MMSKKEKIRETIESNERYLVHSRATIKNIRQQLNMMRQARGTDSDVKYNGPTQDLVDGEAKSMGKYISLVNGKGWRKLSV